MGLQGYSAEIKVFETLFGADENSQREATMTCTGQTFHQEVKEVESWGLRLLAVFRVYFEFRNVLRTILYSLPWWGRLEDIWGPRGFLREQREIICSQGYTGQTIECDCCY